MTLSDLIDSGDYAALRDRVPELLVELHRARHQIASLSDQLAEARTSRARAVSAMYLRQRVPKTAPTSARERMYRLLADSPVPLSVTEMWHRKLTDRRASIPMTAADLVAGGLAMRHRRLGRWVYYVHEAHARSVVLLAIDDEPGGTVEDVARRIGAEVPHVRQMVAEMDRLGWLESVTVLTLTTAGLIAADRWRP